MNSAKLALRPILAAMLCGTLSVGTVPLAESATVVKPAAARKLDKEAQIDLLLSRFTFGPTAFDKQAATRQGLDAWFERQLQPAKIDDYSLERRLDVYPALRMTQVDRLARYPEPATLRQIAKIGVLPNDPETRAIISDQVEFYQMSRAAKAATTTSPTGGAAPGIRQPGGVGQPTAVNGTQPPPVATAVQDAAAQNLEQTVQSMPKPQVDAILLLPPGERYARLLSMHPAELIALRKAARGPLEGRLAEGMTPLEKETLLSLAGTNRMINAETQGARLLRDIYSERQVEAVMTDFWLNHFNVFSGKNGQEPSLLPEYEKTVRAHSLGKFEDLLIVTAQSPAMLMYLDNATSVGPDSTAALRQKKNTKNKGDLGLNENYARELMELHTLGVNGGYTQHDVTEVAKVFTGWTLEKPNDGGDYTFNPNRHQPGSKTFMGKIIADGGEKEGYEVLHLLATSPATAHFISTELAQRFVSDTPPPAMVDRMAKVFLKSNGDIREVLRAMVHSPEFFTTATVNAKLKTPLEYVTSAVRASGAEVSNPLPLVQSLQQLGMPIYGCQPPTGYKWDEATWLSSSALVNRMNFSLALSTNRIGGAVVDWTPRLLQSSGPFSATLQPVLLKLATQAPDPDAARKEALLEATLLDVPVSAQTRDAVLSQGNDDTAKQAAQQFAAAGAGRPLTDAEKEAQQQDRLDAMAAGKLKGPKGQAQPQRGLGASPVKTGPPPVAKQAAAMAGLLLGSPEFQRR